jgi:hypothetical protein
MLMLVVDNVFVTGRQHEPQYEVNESEIPSWRAVILWRSAIIIAVLLSFAQHETRRI